MRAIFFSLAERFAGACALFSASELSKQSRAPTHRKFASRGDVDAYALRLLGKKIEGCETSKQKILGSFAHESWACGPRCDRKVALPRLLDGRSRSSSCPFRPGPPKHEGAALFARLVYSYSALAATGTGVRRLALPASSPSEVRASHRIYCEERQHCQANLNALVEHGRYARVCGAAFQLKGIRTFLFQLYEVFFLFCQRSMQSAKRRAESRVQA